MFGEQPQPPETATEAVDRLIMFLDGEHKIAIAVMEEDELFDLHFNLGLVIRNAFGLHEPGSKLLASCSISHLDDASGMIIAHYGERYRFEITDNRLHGEEMGLQDRDYYWERYKEISRRKSRNSGGIRYLLYTALMIVSLWYGSDAFLNYQETRKLITPEISVASPKPNYVPPISGGIILKTDRQGHFRGTAWVNNVPIPFLIDTGATKTVIPEKMALSAGLPFGRFIQASTAGGKVSERETRINSLKIGNAVIRNLDAHINGHLDEALIGMNTLKYFRMTQSGNTLTLVANTQMGNRSANTPVVSLDSIPAQQSIRKPVTIKKRVICDEHKNCKTSYSDH